MAIPPVDEWVENWSSGLSGSSSKMRKRVEAVTQAPGEKAAAQQEVLLMKFTEAVQSGKWARRVREPGLEGWKQPMLEKGISRATGAASSAATKAKARDKFAQIRAHQEAGLSSLPPRGSDADNEQRMIQWRRHMMKLTTT